MEKSIIFLLGMPGSGKTYTGKKIAKKLGYTFVDLDFYIELVTHQTIQQIFDKKGEDYFRMLETECLKELVESNKIVLACGGGTPCSIQNMDLLNNHGTTIFLDKEVSVLAKNIEKGEKRPMFLGLKKEEIQSKLNEIAILRHPYYKKSDLIVKNIEEVYTILGIDNQ